MTTLVLRFDAPMQSWGLRSRFDDRDTATAPTKSGVVGLLAAATGIPRDGDLAHLARLRLGIRVDREPTIEEDFQTVQNVRSADGKNHKGIVSPRSYLADALYLVALEGEQDLMRQLHSAILNPRWPLYFGRRGFSPAGPITGKAEHALWAAPLDEILRVHPWLEWKPRIRDDALKAAKQGDPVRPRTIVDSSPTVEAAEMVYDYPVSFVSHDRRYQPRFVVHDEIPLTTELLERQDPVTAEVNR